MKLKEIALISTATLLVACNSGSSDSAFENTGTLSLNLSDAPIDEARHVYVSLEGVSLNYEDSGWVDYDFGEVQKIDLLSLQSGNTLPLLDSLQAFPGDYQVRLNIFSNNDITPDNSIVLEEDGVEYEMTIPSGEQTGLKLTSPITVQANRASDYTIDFDVRKSVVKRGQGHNYALRPTLRLINNSASGEISGQISDTSLLNTNCSDEDPLTYNTIYVFEGTDTLPDDIGSTGEQAITTAPVIFDEQSGIYSYTASLLPLGNYTVALTCNSDLEEIEADDELDFKDIQNVTVTAE